MDDLSDFAKSNHRYRVIERTSHSFTRKVSIMGVLFVVLLLAICLLYTSREARAPTSGQGPVLALDVVDHGGAWPRK